MAPSMATADPRVGKAKLGLGLGFEELMRRNLELEREVKEGKEREEEMRRELERTRERLRAVEEAEERLCSQLGDLEAEALAYATAYHRRIKALSDELARAHEIIGSSFDLHRRIIAVDK